MIYRRLASPLHAARAASGAAYCLALALASLTLSNPLAVAAVAVAVAGAGLASGVGRPLARVAVYAVPLGLTVALINALVVRDGLTVIVRLGQLPIIGHTDVTLEATVYGLVLGLRSVILIMCGALYSLAVDPDEVLRALRRLSFRSALTATLATRLMPLLLRDARRLADAERCRPGGRVRRTQLLRAATAGVLDRALDTAVALEVRGYGTARRPPRAGRAVSRHDVGFALSATSVAVLAVAGRAGGVAPFSAYPALHAPAGGGVVALGAAIVLCALLPFADRRGVEP